MKITSGQVKDGRIEILDESRPEGVVETVLVPEETFTLTASNAAELDRRLDEADRGDFVSADELFVRLDRR